MSDRPADGIPDDVLDRLISQAEAEGASAQAQSSAIETGASPASEGVGRGGLEGLLANPALLTALPQLMKAFSGGSASKPSGAAGGDSAKSGRSIPVDRHTALLCALKPYLASERRQAAEQLINLCRVWGTLQGMGISLPALLSSPPAEVTPDRKGDDRV